MERLNGRGFIELRMDANIILTVILVLRDQT